MKSTSKSIKIDYDIKTCTLVVDRHEHVCIRYGISVTRDKLLLKPNLCEAVFYEPNLEEDISFLLKYCLENFNKRKCSIKNI